VQVKQDNTSDHWKVPPDGNNRGLQTGVTYTVTRTLPWALTLWPTTYRRGSRGAQSGREGSHRSGLLLGRSLGVGLPQCSTTWSRPWPLWP